MPIGNWLARTVFAAKFAERNFLFSNVIGANSKILFNRDPAERVEAVAPWLTTDTSVYPAIVNKRMVWIVDGYTTLDNYPYSQLTTLSSATADSNEVALNRLAARQAGVLHPQLGEGHRRRLRRHGHAVRAGRAGSGAAGVDEGVPGHGQAQERHHARNCRQHLRYPEDLFKVQRALLAKYHVNDPGDVLLHVGLLGRAAGSEPDGEQLSSRRTTSSPKTLRPTTIRRHSS